MSNAEEEKFTQCHKDGSFLDVGQIAGKNSVGYWEFFRKDGTKIRSGSYQDGVQFGAWTTYDKAGKVYKVTGMKDSKKGVQKAAVK